MSVKPILPRNFRETKAIREAHAPVRKQWPQRLGKTIPCFNGAEKGNKKRPITLPKVELFRDERGT